MSPLSFYKIVSSGLGILAILFLGISAVSAAETSWYFTDTGTTVPPVSLSSTSSSLDTLMRAPGLSPDLTSYFLNGTYITPAMAFAPAFATSVSAYSARNISPTTFVPRNSASAITFTNLPAAGSAQPESSVLLIDFAYVNPGPDNSFTIRDDIFSPTGLIISSSTIKRDIHTNEYAPFHLPLYFGGMVRENGIYGVRVRAYDEQHGSLPLDENSFNFNLKP